MPVAKTLAKVLNFENFEFFYVIGPAAVVFKENCWGGDNAGSVEAKTKTLDFF